MEEIPERAELRRIQREQERERRRIRDRQRRQAMTQEQRERHLARRRRNYQLRRQRAANANANANVNANNVNAPFISFPPNPIALESSAGEASTSDEFQGANSSTSLDYRVLSRHSHGIGIPHYGQETLNLGTKVSHGSSVNMESLVYKLDNSPRLRLKQIRHLARNVTGLVADSVGTSQVAVELKTNEEVSIGDSSSMPKSLRLNSVKRLARSVNTLPKESEIQKDTNLSPEGIQLHDNESFMAND